MNYIVENEKQGFFFYLGSRRVHLKLNTLNNLNWPKIASPLHLLHFFCYFEKIISFFSSILRLFTLLVYFYSMGSCLVKLRRAMIIVSLFGLSCTMELI